MAWQQGLLLSVDYINLVADLGVYNMATYDYECKDCASTTTIEKPMNDPHPPCPKCQGEMKVVITPITFIRKGTGWGVHNQ